MALGYSFIYSSRGSRPRLVLFLPCWHASRHRMLVKQHAFFPVFPRSELQWPSSPSLYPLPLECMFSFWRYVLRTYYVLGIGKPQEIQGWHPKLPLGPAAVAKQCILLSESLTLSTSHVGACMLGNPVTWQATTPWVSRALIQSSLFCGRSSVGSHPLCILVAGRWQRQLSQQRALVRW